MANNKIVYGGKTLIDLTEDTVSSSNLLKGVKAHDKTGAQIIGTYEADKQVENILENGFTSGDVAYVDTGSTIIATNNTTGQVLTKTFSDNTVTVKLTESNSVVGTLVRTYEDNYSTITSVNSYTGLTTVKKFDYENQKISITTKDGLGKIVQTITKHLST